MNSNGAPGAAPTQAQTRLWISQRAEPDDPSWNMSFGWRLEGDLDLEVLYEAFVRLVVRHDVLGQAFQEVDGAPRLVPATGKAFEWSATDLRDVPEPARRRRCQALIDRVAGRVFDLAQGPLLRVALVQETDTTHVLFVVVHHIVFDGRSQEIMAEDLSNFYLAVQGLGPDPLPLRAPHGVIAEMERVDPTRTSAIRYWTDRLSGLQLGELPLDVSSPTRDKAVGTHTVALPAHALADLREVAQRHNSTLFVTALAGLHVVLTRYTGGVQTVVGTPVSTRNAVDLYDTIGPFFNPVAILATVDPHAKVGDFLESVRNTTLEAFQHANAPYNEVTAALHPGRSGDVGVPLYQSWFEIEQTDDPTVPTFPGITATALPEQPPSLRSDLDVTLKVRSDGLEVRFSYRADLFRPESIERIAAAYADVAASLAHCLHDVVGELGRTGANGDPELRSMCVGAEAFDERTDIVSDVFRWSLETPDRLAVKQGVDNMTYGELLARSRGVAEALICLGLRDEEVVGIHMSRRQDLLPAMLGTMLAGCAYLPLDPDLPDERLRSIVADASPGAVITDRPGSEISSVVPHALPVDQLTSVDGPLSEYPGLRLDGSRLAYVMYTSGSTGTPKGVMIQRGGLTNFVQWCGRAYDSGKSGGAPVFSSVSFDAVVPNLYGPLVNGQPVHLMPTDLDLGELGERLIESGPFTFIKLTPAHLDVLALQLTPAQAQQLCGRLVVGADSFPRAALERWRKLDPATPIINEYGPTEITVANSTYDVESAPTQDVLPIGRPIPGTSMWILDDDLRSVPPGAVGEICVGGVGVARGYLGRPAATAAAFVPDPFSQRSGARIYRTGDYGRVGLDGQVEFRGRRDQQLKIRGFRVEPAEVTSALTAQDEIEAAFVTGCTSPEGTTELVAYLVPSPGCILDDRVVRRRLRKVLPAALVPGHLLVVPVIPLTPHGKVDTRRLPGPTDGVGTGKPEPECVPSVGAELIRVWADVLGVETVKAGDNFFELGGHSLLALKLIARLAVQTGRQLSVRDVFEAPTPADLAARLAQAPETAPPLEAERVSEQDAQPITDEQARILYAQEASGSDTQFNVVGCWSLDGRLDVSALDQAARRLVDRHDALLIRIELRDGVFVQVLASADELQVQHLDLSSSGRVVAHERLREMLLEMDGAPFVMGRPLVQIRLVRIAPEEHVFAVAGHHVLLDGWSLGLLVRDLGELYSATVQGRPDRLPQLRGTYLDAAARSARSPGPLPSSAPAQVVDIEPVALPRDRSGDDGSAHGDVVSWLLPRETWERVLEVARAHRTTPFAVLLTGVQLVVSSFASSDHFTFGFSEAGRDDPQVHDIVGPFFRQALGVADLRGDPTAAEAIARVRTGLIEARARLDARPARTRTVPAQSLWFEMETEQGPSAFPADIRLGDLPLRTTQVKNDLVFSLQVTDSGVDVILGYRDSEFTRNTATRLLEDFARAIEAIASDPRCRVAELNGSGAAVTEPDSAPFAVSPVEPKPLPLIDGATTRTIARLVAAAAEVIGVSDVSAADNFFELGGDSIRALRFVGMLRGEGLVLTVRDLVGLSTFAELAEAVEATSNVEPEPDAAPSSLVHLRMASGGRRLFCIHPSGGGVHWYFNLAEVLPPGCGLSAFQALDGRWLSHDRVTVEDMAAAYAEELSREADTGPYTILGWSASGAWAIEMARQLKARGVAVGPIILVEPALPDLTGRAEIRQAWSDFSQAADLVEAIHGGRCAPNQAAALQEQLVALVAASGVLADRVPEMTTSGELRMAAELEMALLNYVPQPFDGKVEMIVGSEVAVADADHPSRVAGASEVAYLNRWRTNFPDGGLTVHHIGGGHISIVQDRDHAAEIAEVVAACWEDERRTAETRAGVAVGGA